jgi:hypothetical protein
MTPAQQGFEAKDLASGRGLRLEIQFQLVLLQCRGDVVLQRAPDLAAHRRIEEANASALIALGAIKRRLGIGNQDVDVRAVLWIDACPIVKLPSISYPSTQTGWSSTADSLTQSVSAVAGGVAVDVVDFLELIEVDAQHRKSLLAGRGGLEGLGDVFVERRPVWQPGELVVERQVRDPRLVLRALGDILVGGDPAAVLRRPVGNVDDPAVDQFRDQVVRRTGRNRALQPGTIMSEVAIGRSRSISSRVHPANNLPGAILYILA